MTPRRIAALTLGLVLILAVAAAAAGPSSAPPAGVRPWAEKNFVHPPLKCMEPYKRIDEYPVAAWCFHGSGIRGRLPYDEKYARDAKAVGFNVLIDAAAMLEPCRKVGGMKVVVPVFWAPPDKLMATIFKPRGDHAALLGLVLDDNCTAIHPQVAQNGKWVTENYPHVMPWISENPNPQAQSKTTVRVLGTQNYPFLRGARGEKATKAYCDGLNYDRVFGNSHDMSAWEIFGGDNEFNQIRFQMMSALAYGSQGLVNFAYAPHRMEKYKPGNALIPKFKVMHTYITQVLGRHLWGTRCLDVIHSDTGGMHRNAPTPNAERLVVNTSKFFLVGLLTPESRFSSKNPADRAVPEYLMLVDKRTGGATPELRNVFVMLSLSIPAAEMLDADAVPGHQGRKIVPGWKVRAKMEGGDALLLRVPPDLETLLGGKEGMRLYDEINRTMAGLQWQLTPPPPAQAAAQPAKVSGQEADRATAAARTKLAELEKLLGAAARAGRISGAQAADTISRLRAAIDATRKEVNSPAQDD